ncbi:MAG: hypothetical protein JJU41_13030 [Bacteroidetes bacterium]|nr:hypothetical protein [Bacteroidota bacterium]MCH8524391.1 hypothetical protein [Balneolales bacterium]
MLNFILFIAVFLTASFGSSWIMVRLGYPLPRKLDNREDWLLLVFKLILFTIVALVLFAILLLFGQDVAGISARFIPD